MAKKIAKGKKCKVETVEFEMSLAKAAKKDGGDKYSAELEGEDRAVVFYIPQSISRGDADKPRKSLTVTIG